MQSDQIKSQTSTILANLQKKISKYLSPSYQTSDILDKSKAIIKTHEEIIQSNKDFIKQNQSQQFIKTQTLNPGNQFDHLLHRRKKCQAKLHSMLLDHQVEESLRFDFSPSKNKTHNQASNSSYRPTCNDLFSVSSLKQFKSQVLSPTSTEPNFLRIQKQLQNMQKKLQKLNKKVDKKNSSKKLKSKKEVIQESKITQFSKDKNPHRKNTNARNQSTGSQCNLPLKCKSPSLKKGSSVQIHRKASSHQICKPQRQNSEENISKQKIYKNQPDQTSLFAKLTKQNAKIPQKNGDQSSKLKKVGLMKFNQNSKKTIQTAKCKNFEQKSKPQDRISSPKHNKNHIKVNLLQCESQHVL